MDSFDHEVSVRAYNSRFQRHAIYSTVSFEPMPLSTPIYLPKETLSGEAAESIVISFFTTLFWSIFKHTSWTLLGYLAIRVVPFVRVGEWARETIRQLVPQLRADLRSLLNLFALLVVAIYRGFTRNQYIFDARQAIRDRYHSTQRRVDRSYEDFANATFATIYVQFQRVITWTGRHKFRLIVGIVAIHLLSTMISSPEAELGDVFVTWNELQPYIDQPIPWHMFRQRSEDGSNSHYWPPQLIEDAPLESAGPISTTPTTTMLPAAATDDFVEDAPTENCRKLLGDEMAFCHHCRQKHCCEICL